MICHIIYIIRLAFVAKKFVNPLDLILNYSHFLSDFFIHSSKVPLASL
jgi:hypothetical protein